MQSVVVGDYVLSEENRQDLDRVQNSACKLILKNRYESDQKALAIFDLKDSNHRRNQLCEAFAIKAFKNSSIIFKPNDNIHILNLRNPSKLKVTSCRTERYIKSALPSMQVMLNRLA